ncbi:M48 family peptidase [Aerosakkonemataceae cyanobacterium BLCC-F50]|uniref:M48 family peptidase n=1 Tax=Floridaenema flaviceps BLCC-F50 TaxID=3153642 RepID=A0ABV4XIV1_9CYAN
MLQIRGIVKTAQKAQDSLKVGISPREVPAFKKFITTSVETIEHLCTQSNIKPAQLPSRSRQAYFFLKSIDLDNLPLVENSAQSQTSQTISIKNIKNQQQIVSQKFAQLVANYETDIPQIQDVHKTLERSVSAIEQICAANKATPASLTNSSRSIYAWMKFLTDRRFLELHLETSYRSHQIALEICRNHFEESVNPIVELNNISRLYKSRKQGNTVTVVINEGFINASNEVLKALIKDALLGKTQENTSLIREFASSEEFSDILLEIDLIAEAIAENPIGKCYNLKQVFERVNREYFDGAIALPRLTWSQIHTYRKFGHYEPAKDRVVISLTLDDRRIPEFVTEFVLYHELLHKHHGATWVNGRRMVHTPEFRRDERKFKLYNEASEWLKQLASSQAAMLV